MNLIKEWRGNRNKVKKKGIEQRNIEIAKNLLDILDLKIISLKTGLSMNILKQISKNI